MKRTLLVLLALGSIAAFASTQANKQKPQSVGGTRLAVVNLALVMTRYGGSSFKATAGGSLEALREKAKNNVHEMIELEMKASEYGLPSHEKKLLDDKIQDAKHRLEDLNRDITKLLGKKSEDKFVAIWKEVQDAARIYATENGIDMVLAYGDPLEKEMLDRFPNVNRKMQAMDQGGTVPFFVSPREDITAGVIAVINKRRR